MEILDYKKIKSKFCFMDESGSLSALAQEFFTIGILKMRMPYYLQSRLSFERQKTNFHDEFKFNKLSAKNIKFYKFIIDSVLDTKSLDFYSYTIEKSTDYYKKNFEPNVWDAYTKLTLKLLDDVWGENEILILIADHVQTPKDIKFEVDVERDFNLNKNTLALAGVCRFDSKTNDMLQLVDLLIGCITYDIKMSLGKVKGHTQKIELVEYLKSKLKAKRFLDGFKNENFNVMINLEPNEKGPSS